MFSSGYFTIKIRRNRATDLEALLEQSSVSIGLVIPPDFAADLDAGRPAQLQAIVDGSDANTATIILGYTQAIVQSYSAKLQPGSAFVSDDGQNFSFFYLDINVGECLQAAEGKGKVFDRELVLISCHINLEIPYFLPIYINVY